MQRDKIRTQRRLVDATIELLREGGFSAVGINAIADRAGVSKVLIYRYFDGIGGLYRAVAEHLDISQTRVVDLSPLESGASGAVRDTARTAFLMMHEQLLSDELAVQVLIQELDEENELTRTFAETREAQGTAVTRRVAELAALREREGEPGAGDFDAVFAVVSAAIYYLSLRSRTVQLFNNIDIRSESGWYRICDALAGLVESAFPARAARTEDGPATNDREAP